MPVEYKAGYPTVDDRYNTATEFLVRAKFANDVVMDIRHDLENGVKFEGEHGHIFVTRDRIDLDGGAVDALYKNPVPESLLKELRKGKPVDGHMANFFECVARPLGARLRRLVAPPGADHLPPGEYRDAAGPSEAHLGPRQGRDRRRLRGQRLPDPSSARPVRDRLIDRKTLPTRNERLQVPSFRGACKRSMALAATRCSRSTNLSRSIH